MSNRKDIAIQKVMSDLESLANLVLSQLSKIDVLLSNGEMNLTSDETDKFIENENKIDKLEVKLSERIVSTIVLYQPVASEIRQIISCYRIVNSLERIGDYAVELVKFLQNIKNIEIYNELSNLIKSLFASSCEMLKKALISFVTQDKISALWVLKRDAHVDEMSQTTIKQVIQKSKDFDEKKKVIISFINIKEMIDNIERIADHATNIAESAIYYIDGKDIRHIPLLED